MFQNIKVDMIYYKAGTDFELEFNLCGCCRMRLLTDKASDKKNLLNLLVRAVARSRVILIAGDLFGNDGIINIVSNAINKGIVEIDNSNYGILSDDSISIIDGSTPLVTPEGYFGGCIIESGPQSMILLSKNKTIRKSIMQTLIHPYIAELASTDFEKTETAVPNIEPAINNIPESEAAASVAATALPVIENIIPTADITDIDTAIPKTANESDIVETNQAIESPLTETNENELENNIEFNTDNTTAYLTPGIADYSDIINSHNKLNRKNSDNYDIQNNEFDYSSPFFGGQELNERRPVYTMSIPILIISVILLILSAILCYCIIYVPAKQGISASEYLKEIFSTLFP